MAALIIIAQYWKKLKCLIFSYWSVAQLSWTLFAAPLTLVCQSQIWIVWISQARILEWVVVAYSRGSS